MPLPRVVAQFNKRVTNRFLEPIARRSAGFVVVNHVGRRSGVEFSTPVNLFRLTDDDRDGVHRDNGIVALTYGPGADWVRNVLADGGVVEDRAGQRGIAEATVVGREIAWPVLPPIVRCALRVMRVRDFMRLTYDVGESNRAAADAEGRR